MTDARREASASPVLREVVRRAGHEIRNALSGVAVNLEVVRSRSGREGAGDIASFADRARLQVSAATALTNGLLALVNATLPDQPHAKAKTSAKAGDSVELLLNRDASAFMSDIDQLARAIGISVEQRGANVILKVLPEGQSHSKD
ncbi:MAG: hypothetical protein AUG20_00425 [Gemmatimonas sp. 13_1_20CM_3_60_15]|nr:MAG: hypothetical protein AUG20_00425 [Gemmatimonas sp. 13_1_20CM_3_60_15]